MACKQGADGEFGNQDELADSKLNSKPRGVTFEELQGAQRDEMQRARLKFYVSQRVPRAF